MSRQHKPQTVSHSTQIRICPSCNVENPRDHFFISHFSNNPIGKCRKCRADDSRKSKALKPKNIIYTFESGIDVKLCKKLNDLWKATTHNFPLYKRVFYAKSVLHNLE